MTTKRPISWFLTDQGRAFSFAFVTGAGIAATTARFAPHTFFIEKYKDFVHNYHNGKPVDLPLELKNRYNKCLEILKVPEHQKKLYSPFSVFGYDLFSAGSWYTRNGAIVGIPVHFTYKTLNDIKEQDIKVNQKKVDWESEAGMKLADSILLPEKVQEFAICREILSTQNIKLYLQSTYPFVCMFFGYNVAQKANKRLNLYSLPASARCVMYSLVASFSMGLYFLLHDYTEVYYETVVDKKLCEVNPEFVECGVTFYDKMLKRNQALRELMGKEGESKYTKFGNENFGVRQPRIALVHRKQFFQNQLEQKEGEDGKEET
ncbi:hypothetical protein JYU34_008852 [Plutella xylostella]|uniref:Transmembrane protein 177 n=1 Tax=Plutella xylostella TaxID=51655 RepID=A0ABQ7QM47_PLUXY|nr:hypothetical protein JYU34_008852 [Plutella xylostella]